MSRSGMFAGVALVMTMIACSDDPTGVVVPAVVTVDVAPADQVLAVGDTLRLTAYPRVADGGVRGGVPIEWRSLSTGVATVQGDGIVGRVKAVSPGTVRIEAKSEGKIGFVTVTVVAAPGPVVASVEIAPSYVALDIGQQHELRAVAKAVDGAVISGRNVTWTSTWPAIASVTANENSAAATVNAQATGLVKIRATVDGVVGEAEVQVRAPEIPVATVVLTPLHRGIWVGTTASYADGVHVLAQNGTPLPGRTVTWSVENQSVATIDDQGNVLGVAAGTTRVFAHSGGKTGSALITVFAVPQGPAVYDLTYDWWDGEFQVLRSVGTVRWIDGSGVARKLPLYLLEGTLTMNPNGTYERRLVLKASAVVNGTNQWVVTREEVDRGNVYIKVGGETGYDMVSTTTPGYGFEAVGWYNAGHLLVRQAVGTLAVSDYLFRLHQ